MIEKRKEKYCTHVGSQTWDYRITLHQLLLSKSANMNGIFVAEATSKFLFSKKFLNT